ncbi:MULTISPECIES: helix-turn-helix domain-containing protein [Dethiosulfovibrio]|uniref:Helix-turn-helix domain-containing protein n=2 Tax=Dethiosulfovibrio TaxID=47054 RepID=A0ABS9EQY3_9BACT|nr:MULTISPECIES: helix-turn-helix domain-containing protein [Dethiosulfovibrio]MCF4115119.1 helix-turn-helix domain-containing protein [Dethiosulfovibrio russensis]MCF4143602.1 helix-turn-helix domain-containing protein [Dethiosulfovibrio marinus]MCF4146073.1 helix-turn-helix domain-containing protein [Dethiosulfovibrio acidaminovorans]
MERNMVIDNRKFWFARVDISVLMDEGKGIDAYAKATYAVLCAYAGSDRECFPSAETLAAKVGCSRDRLFKSLKILEDAGCISRQSQTNKSFQTVNRYILNGSNPVEGVRQTDTESPSERLPQSVSRTPGVRQADPRCPSDGHRTRDIELEPKNHKNIVGKSAEETAELPLDPVPGEAMPQTQPGETPPPCPYRAIADLWDKAMVPLGKRGVRILSEARQSALRARWRSRGDNPEGPVWPWADLATWEAYFGYVAESKFLVEGRFCDFDWVIKKTNWIKIREGKYHQEGDCR